MKGEH